MALITLDETVVDDLIYKLRQDVSVLRACGVVSKNDLFRSLKTIDFLERVALNDYQADTSSLSERAGLRALLSSMAERS